MGTDIYLHHSALEEGDQITGFSIDAGDKGYLRASIGMTSENSVLRRLMPNHWDYDYDEFPDGKPYNFEQNWQLAQELGAMYLFSALTGKEMDYDIEEQKEMRDNVMGTLAEFGFEVESSETLQDIPSAVMWLNSLFEFFRLGMRLEKQTDEQPRVHISW